MKIGENRSIFKNKTMKLLWLAIFINLIVGCSYSEYMENKEEVSILLHEDEEFADDSDETVDVYDETPDLFYEIDDSMNCENEEIDCNNIKVQVDELTWSIWLAGEEIRWGRTDEETDHNNADIQNDNPILGTWLLEELIIWEGLLGSDEVSPVALIDVAQYLGETITFATDFVQLGDRTMVCPDYEKARRYTPLVSLEDIANYSFYQDIFGHFDSKEEMLAHGLDVRYHRWDDNYVLYVENFDIRYPYYFPELWLRSVYKIDPIIPELTEFHPLFRHVWVLDENTLLVGWFSSQFLARRVE